MKDSAGRKRLRAPSGILFFETLKRVEMLQANLFSYRTISETTQGGFKEKGSRFLSFAFPVSHEAEIKSHLSDLAKAYFDARHHSFAWILGPDKRLFKAHDAGEPHHSAGDPILGQLRSRDLTDVLVVVVRYFGGTKLGIGGLVSAYKSAAADALDKAVIVERELTSKWVVNYPYSSTPEVMRLIKDLELSVEEQTFQEECVLQAQGKRRLEKAIHEKLALLKSLGIVRDFSAA